MSITSWFDVWYRLNLNEVLFYESDEIYGVDICCSKIELKEFVVKFLTRDYRTYIIEFMFLHLIKWLLPIVYDFSFFWTESFSLKISLHLLSIYEILIILISSVRRNTLKIREINFSFFINWLCRKLKPNSCLTSSWPELLLINAIVIHLNKKVWPLVMTIIKLMINTLTKRYNEANCIARDWVIRKSSVVKFASPYHRV